MPNTESIVTQYDYPQDSTDSIPAIPADPDAERALLACIVLNPDLFYEYGDRLSKDDFYVSAHRRLWGQMRDAVLGGVVDLSDPIAVCGDDVETQMVLLDASTNYSPGNVDAYFKRVKYLAGKRGWLATAQQAAEMSLNGKTPAEIADFLQGAVTESYRRDADNPFERLEGEIFNGVALAGMEVAERRYIAEDLIRVGSLSIFYGAPGDFKSMILMDLAVCVALGIPWLQPLPAEGNNSRALQTQEGRCLWVNYDQGTDDVIERFQGLQNAHGTTGDLDVLSHPPMLFAPTTESEARAAGMWLAKRKYSLVVIDSLIDVRGEADLKEAEMGDVLRLWRIVTETSGAAIILISHSTKETKDLYGSQFIKAKLDHAYHVTRSGDIAIVKATKQRSHGLDQLKARWCWSWKDGTRTLQSGRFMGDDSASTEHHPNNTTQADCHDVLMASPGQALTVDEVLDAVNERRADQGDELLTKGAVKVALNRLEKNERNIGKLSDPVRYHFGELSQ